MLSKSNFLKFSCYAPFHTKEFKTRRIFTTHLKNNVLKTTKEIFDEYGYGYGNKMIYNSTVEHIKSKLGYKTDFQHQIVKNVYKKKVQRALETIQPLPLSLKYYSNEVISSEGQNQEEKISQNVFEAVSSEMDHNNFQHRNYTNFPLDITHSYEKDKPLNIIHNISKSDSSLVDEEIRLKYQQLKNKRNWMAAYENFEHDMEETEENEMLLEDWTMNYGTSNPNSKISGVPCGGCGALLHCKDPGIPGYIPFEIFKNHEKDGGVPLEAIICQRCYFLKEHNLALDVQVSPEDYPNVLMAINKHRALVILMIDLVDFPCSIWPGIADIMGARTPIFIVGNKIDLLPKDDNRFLSNVKNNLLNNIKLFGFGSMNILDVTLISAKTGYGVENLLTSLYQKWKYKGDVYLVGCTNVGKSTLFNALLQSDFCKVQAKDLVQRATTSLWPGTTLNLLKFPILNPTHFRLYLRNMRLKEMKKLNTEREKLRTEELKKSNTIENATLIDHIGQTFGKRVVVNEHSDTFSTYDRSKSSGRTLMGVNEKDPQYALSKWCFDTPGVVQPDQILNILTADELMYVVPRELIKPETFILKPGMTLFIGGLARLDFVDGEQRARFTVFRSNELPITVCYTEASDKLYNDFLGTNFFKVPINDGDRLSKWPGLELAKTFTITGIGWKQSSKDIVLSNAGWIALNCAQGEIYKFQAWTPEKRGVYIRDCLLPKAVLLRGKKIQNNVAYREHKLI